MTKLLTIVLTPIVWILLMPFRLIQWLLYLILIKLPLNVGKYIIKLPFKILKWIIVSATVITVIVLSIWAIFAFAI